MQTSKRWRRWSEREALACVFVFVFASTACGPPDESVDAGGWETNVADAAHDTAGDTRDGGVGDADSDADADGADGDAADGIACMDISEQCNGTDDDCDEVVDEGCGCNYDDTETGVCSEATLGEDRGECRPPDAYEMDETTCDDRDNDCDGIADEGCDCAYDGRSTGVCTGGTVSEEDGSCQKPDAYVSTENGFTDESHCDQQDNDCDGGTDEGCECHYQDTDQGVCSEAIREFPDGKCVPPRSHQAEETVCDGNDNDCDGEVDEECTCVVGSTSSCYTGPSGTKEVGICQSGTRTCIEDGTEATWGPCENQTLPSNENCSGGRDDDCDGNVDENQSVAEGFDGADSGWRTYNNGSNSVSIDVDAGTSRTGSQAGAAEGSDGVCGDGGLAKSFEFSKPADQLTVWVKATTDNWGRVAIMIEDSSGVETLWRNKGSGSGVNMSWTQKTFDLSSYDRKFTLIFGNDDDSQYCSNSDHSWKLWVDDLTVEASCP